jgi:hypothetical protein
VEYDSLSRLYSQDLHAEKSKFEQELLATTVLSDIVQGICGVCVCVCVLCCGERNEH